MAWMEARQASLSDIDPVVLRRHLTGIELAVEKHRVVLEDSGALPTNEQLADLAFTMYQIQRRVNNLREVLGP